MNGLLIIDYLIFHFKQLSENSKEKKIVIRNNYKPCEKADRTDRLMNSDQEKDESVINKTQVQRKPEISSISFIPDIISDRTIVDQKMIDRLKTDRTQSDRTASDRTSNTKTKSKKTRNKSKEMKEKQKIMMNKVVPNYPNFVIPIIKSPMPTINHQMGSSYPVYIPENPLADYVRQRLIEHPIIYQIEESHDYPLFLSQFNIHPTSSTLQLKSNQPLNYAATHLNNGLLHDYAYLNTHYQNTHHQYQQAQQAQLLQALIPQLIQSTLTKKPINLVPNLISGPALNYPLLSLPTYKYVNFQSPNENVLENNLFNKQLNSLLTKGLVYPPPSPPNNHAFMNAPNTKPFPYSKHQSINKDKLSEPKKDFKDFKEFKSIFNSDYNSNFDNFNKDFLKDYSTSQFNKDLSKDYLTNFNGKDYSTSNYQTGFPMNNYQKEYSNKDYNDKEYTGTYQNHYSNKFNKSEPYFRLPLFRKSDDDEDVVKTALKYPLFSNTKDDLFSTLFNEQPTISKKEDNENDSFKPIIVYSKLLTENGNSFIKRNSSLLNALNSGLKIQNSLDTNSSSLFDNNRSLFSSNQFGSQFESNNLFDNNQFSDELKDSFEMTNNSTDYFMKSTNKLDSKINSTAADDNSLEFDY